MELLLKGRWIVAAVSLAVLTAAALSLAGCNHGVNEGTGGSSGEASSSLGEPVKGDLPTVCAALTADKLGQTVAVEGEIVQQCPASGCWFRVKDDAGEVFVDLAPAKLRLTKDRVGQHARVTGRVVKLGGQYRLEAQHVIFGTDANAPPSQETE